MQPHIAMLADAYCDAVQCDERSGRIIFWKLQQRVQRNILDKLKERDDAPASLRWQATMFDEFVTGMVHKAVLDFARRPVEAEATPEEVANRVDSSPEAAEALVLFSDDASSTMDSVAEEQATTPTGQDANPLVLLGSMEYVREHLSHSGRESAKAELKEVAGDEPDPRRCYVVFRMSDGSEERYYGDWHTSCYPGKDTVYFDDGEVHLLPREDIVFVSSKSRKRLRAKAEPTAESEVVHKARAVEQARKRPRVSLEAPLTQHLCTWGCGQPSDHKGLCFALQASRLRSKAS